MLTAWDWKHRYVILYSFFQEMRLFDGWRDIIIVIIILFVMKVHKFWIQGFFFFVTYV